LLSANTSLGIAEEGQSRDFNCAGESSVPAGIEVEAMTTCGPLAAFGDFVSCATKNAATAPKTRELPIRNDGFKVNPDYIDYTAWSTRGSPRGEMTYLT
jgi:hypothetical protein